MGTFLIYSDNRVDMGQVESYTTGLASITKKYFDPKHPIDTSQYPEHLRVFMQREAMKKRLALLGLILLVLFVLYQIYRLF